MSDLSRDAAREFLKKIEGMLGAPRVGGNSAEERQRALAERYSGMMDRLQRFGPSVLGRAADCLIENRKSFPALADCIQVCTQIQAKDAEALGTSRPKFEKKRDWTDPAIAKEADTIMLSNLDLARRAAREGWLLNLWYFCAEKGRWPLGCNAEGEDECHTLHLSALETKARMEEIRRRPDGSVCEPCARARGATPARTIDETWSAECMHCKSQTVCNSPVDWIWPGVGAISSMARKTLAFQERVQARTAAAEQRLLELIESRRAA